MEKAAASHHTQTATTTAAQENLQRGAVGRRRSLSGFRRDWVRNYGYAAKGKPCVVEHDWHGKNQVNAIGAWHKDKHLFAVGLFEQGINGTVFQTWVEKVLLPQLPCNSVVVMDNASFHKRAALIRLLEEKGHTVLWLPPYSPDFNPIEKV